MEFMAGVSEGGGGGRVAAVGTVEGGWREGENLAPSCHGRAAGKHMRK
jgi:hypothetical protein